LAALAVAVVHYSPTTAPSDAIPVQLRNIGIQFSVANLSVTFFYGLSAFLLTYIELRSRQAGKRMNVGRFYVRRTLRIWPLYFFILALGLLLMSPGGISAYARDDNRANWSWSLQHLWTYLTFTSNWSLALNGLGGFADHATANLQILWSIAVEEQFYLLFPFFLLLCFWRPDFWRKLMAAAIFVGFGFRVALAWAGASLAGKPAGSMYYGTFSYLEVFGAGALAAVIFTAETDVAFKIRALFRRRTVGLIIPVALLGLGWLWNFYLFPPYGSATSGSHRFVDCAIAVTIYPVAGALISAALLGVALNQQSLLSRFLKMRWMRGLGTLSFGIYVWHPLVQPLIRALDTNSVATLPPQTRLLGVDLMFVLYLALTVSCAAVSYFLVEAPVLRWKERWNSAVATKQLYDDGRNPGSIFVAAVATALCSAILVFAQVLRPFFPPPSARSDKASLQLSSPPLNGTAKRVSPRTVELEWSNVPGAVEYQIEMAAGSGPFQTIGKTSGLQPVYRISDLDSQSVYRFRIRGCTQGGPCSPYTAEIVSSSSNAVLGSVPEGLKAKRQKPSLVRLSWTPLIGLNEYKIEMARKSGAFEQIASTTSAHFDVGNLAPTERVRFRVRSCGSNGLCSAYSPIVISLPLQQ
jgi:peptidoglycan/LPS O-acetylase OafA/YrhL